MMTELLITGLPDDVITRLNSKASLVGLTLDEYLRRVLEEASLLSRQEFLALADSIAESTRGRPQTDSTIIIRALRDADWE